MKKTIILALCALVLASCGPANVLTRSSLYPKMYEEKPVVLLVLPPINNSSNVEAKEYLYTSISDPLAEAGYYVISPFLAMDILRSESAYDAELFVEAPLGNFARFFGADAVVFSEINTWTKRGFGIDTEIRYFIRSTSSGEILFDRTCDLYLDLSSTSSSNTLLGAVIDLAVSTLKTITTEHITAARSANEFIFQDIPSGKYRDNYLQDQETEADRQNISATIKG